ncbi:hypothetical protein B0J13DRAFT_653225 [Dactylonectria estremocensis]|uniref:Cell wall anchored protein n=1 Tax=Dactylonectria estremocensis TaxID=1079267 RepID=A0A9P9ICM6_9HYPO|nr:hypothetical protein B0J13DRAFT_653225 [Dactylonectria estremocensis]
MWTSLSQTNQHRELRVILVLLACYIGNTVQQREPISNFCRRWGHQSAVVDNKLYIDGGLVTWRPSSQPPENYTNPYFVYHDLSQNASSGMRPPYANLSKNSSIPNVNGAILWPDDINKRIYLFGGEFYDEPPWPFALYSYDIINDYWVNHGAPGSPDIGSLSYGASLSISSRGEGYYYGGWMNNATDASWGSGPGILTSYLLKYDMDSNLWTNTTAPDKVGRAEGVMVYIPAGDGGMIIYFGGIRDAGNGTWEGQPMEEIIIYDILSGKPYVQNATGNVPEPRRRFCAGVTWPDDQSSYNIYLYGGAGKAEGNAGFDDIYVLTIPTFTWIRIYPTDSNKIGDFPHHSFSCNVVNKAQMLIHGGFFPLNNDCDSPEQWGLHNLDMGKKNSYNSPWALYDPSKTHYVVPIDIISVVGGSAEGGANKMAPTHGFDHQDLRVLMTRKASAASRNPTRAIPGEDPGPKQGLSIGAIAGIAVGGLVILNAVLVGVFYLIRQHRRRKMADRSHLPITQSYSNSSHQYSQSPPPFQSRPQTVLRHAGPPVELPSG